jgi:hypothetical protein
MPPIKRQVIDLNVSPPRRKGAGSVQVWQESERVRHSFDQEQLTRPPAEAILATLGRAFKRPTRLASAATQAFRASAERSYRAGKMWAGYRYTTHIPNRSQLFGYDSGKMAEELELKRIPVGYAVLTPKGRGVTPDMAAAIPVLSDPREMFRDPAVSAALKRAADTIMRVDRLR